MTSSDNLFSLLNQLQVMETSLTNFMIETVLRLRTLTETKVFLLVETAGSERKRRYCGAAELVDSYERGGLAGRVEDSRVELDATVNTLIDRPSRKRCYNVVGFAPPAETAVVQEPATSEAWPSTRVLPISGFNDGEVVPRVDGVDISTPVKRKKTTKDPSPLVVPFAASAAKENTPSWRADVMKLEPFGAADEDAAECYLIEDDDDDDVEDVDDGGGDLSFYQNPFVPPQNGASETEGGYVISNFFNRLPAPLLDEKKFHAILTTANPYRAYEKGTVENKLWKSVLYDVGKNIALNCPYSDKSRKNEEVQSYFSYQCDQFMRHCGALLVDKDRRPEIQIPENDCLKSCTVSGFIRHCIRHGYTQGSKKGSS